MNRQQGPGRPLQNISNMGSQQPTQPRNTTPGSRLVQSKSGAWGSNAAAASQSLSQAHEQSNSWAQAMNPRSNTQLDLSSSSFPTLGGGNSQSHTPGAPSSQWQAGPPAREQGQQNPRMIQQRQQQGRDQAFGNDFSSMEQSAGRFQSQHTSLPRGAPPGLAPIDGMSPDSNATPSQSRKTPLSQPVNGSIGQERSINGEQQQAQPPQPQLGQSPPAALPSRPKQIISSPTQTSAQQAHHSPSSNNPLASLSEKDKYGMLGYQALYNSPAAEYKAADRAQDVAVFEHTLSAGQHLLRTYPGPFASANAFPPRPLASDYTIPDCYIVHNVAPIQSRISGFTEDTLFYIFYTSPRDIIQEEVATELMSRKWRFHMKERMWLTRDDGTPNPAIVEKDVAEQGYYIWWDYKNWKRVRKAYLLRYEDLDDHLSGGGRLALPGLFQGGFGGAAGPAGIVGGVNGANVGAPGSGAAGAGAGGGNGNFNAVPSLERMAALGGRF